MKVAARAREPSRNRRFMANVAHRVESVVIGAGVVGLAVARALARCGREVIVLESASSFGTGTSSRNSEVVHAGIYYPKGSLKAKACVQGRRMLYEYCETRGVAIRRCGKLIVATDEAELPMLEQIESMALTNGVHGEGETLQRLRRDQVAAREPEVRCVGALLSPATGIIDSHGLMTALLADAEALGCIVAYSTHVQGGELLSSSGRVLLRMADETLLECDELVNAAGHGAPAIARAIAGLPRTVASRVPTPRYAKGTYFGLSCASPFRGLVYPVPQQAGLGVHATIDLAGRCRFGPDVEWTDSEDDVQVDLRRAEAFYKEVRKYWPALPDNALVPDYAGVRPKIQGPGEPNRDFELLGPKEHGMRGLVHLFGIESPGLTASLALADAVVEALNSTTNGIGTFDLSKATSRRHKL